MKRGPVPKPLRERMADGAAPCPDAGCECLLWKSGTNGKGYCQMRIDGRMWLVHRVAWLLEIGPIPAGLVIDHVLARGCTHRNCVNVAHLEAVTQRENVLRGDAVALRRSGGHCVAGHEFNLLNTYYRRDGGGRACRQCRRESQALRRAQGRAA